MKMPIEWHEECLRNSERKLQREQEELNRRIEGLGLLRKEVEFRRSQFNTAVERLLDGYDADKFLVNKKSKPV